MASHEFGIMESSPKYTQKYHKYEPKKYKYIKINDDFIEPLLPKFESIPYLYYKRLLIYYNIKINSSGTLSIRKLLLTISITIHILYIYNMNSIY